MSRNYPFDATYYKHLLEAFHDSQKDLTQNSVDMHNIFVDKTCDYLDKCRPFTPHEISEFTFLLTHPKKMVRVNSAIHLLSMGVVAAWEPMIEAAAPLFMPSEGDEEGWKSYFATQSARRYLKRKYEELKPLGLSPSLEDMEDHWATENRPKIRITKPRG